MLTSLLFIISLPFANSHPAIASPAGYVGHWRGDTRIIVTFVQQKTLAVDLVIRPDGSVSGTVGDARITRGEFREHSTLEKSTGNKGYVVQVDLDGDVIASEKLHRDGAFIRVSLADGVLTGGVTTTGGEGLPFAPGYNRQHMAVSCNNLRLEKAP